MFHIMLQPMLKEADVILTHNGGDSAIREMIEELIVSEGLEEEYLALWS